MTEHSRQVVRSLRGCQFCPRANRLTQLLPHSRRGSRGQASLELGSLFEQFRCSTCGFPFPGRASLADKSGGSMIASLRRLHDSKEELGARYLAERAQAGYQCDGVLGGYRLQPFSSSAPFRFGIPASARPAAIRSRTMSRVSRGCSSASSRNVAESLLPEDAKWASTLARAGSGRCLISGILFARSAASVLAPPSNATPGRKRISASSRVRGTMSARIAALASGVPLCRARSEACCTEALLANPRTAKGLSNSE